MKTEDYVHKHVPLVKRIAYHLMAKLPASVQVDNLKKRGRSCFAFPRRKKQKARPDPTQRLSGSSVKGRTMMSRTGHADLRRALHMPGLVARRHNPALKIFGDRLSAAGLAPKAVVGAVMRKLAHLIYGVIKSGQPFDVNLACARVDFQDGI